MITRRNNSTVVSPFKKENVEAILPLSAMQEAFLWLREQVQSDPGALLAEAMLAGPFQRVLFEEAWNCEIQRHEMLRASVRKRENQRSMLIVWKRLPQEFAFYDLSHLDEAGQVSELQKLREHPACDIDPTDPPCSKISLARLGSEKHRLLWSFHHLFFDGWSTSVVLRDVLFRYQSMLEGDHLQLPIKPSIRGYLNCLGSVDQSESEIYWRERLAGYRGSPKFAVENRAIQNVGKPGELECCLDIRTSKRINQLIRVENLTANSIAAASWSIILGSLLGQPAVVFGTTASGRNLPIEGMHNLVGMFANVVPCHIRLNRESTTLREWLTEIRDGQFEAQPHEHRLLVEMEEWCQLEPGRVLCESLLVVENFPLETHRESDGKLVLQDFKSGTASSYPIACYVIPGTRWKIKIEFDRRVISDKTAAKIVDQLGRVVRGLSESTFDLQVQEFVGSLQVPSFDEISFSDEGQRCVNGLDDDQFTDRYNETELELTSIWENVLGVSPIGLDDGFFDLGGKSMTAVRVVNKIQGAFGISLPPTALIEHTTIRQVSQIVSGGQIQPHPTLVKFNRQESGEPIICLHVGGGYSTYYRFLAGLLPGHPVIGLHPKGLEGSPPLESFPELAAYFIEQLDQLYGSRRFHLVGYCMSAALALEMAHQLEAKSNCPTPSLTIIDSGPKWVHRKLGLAEFTESESSLGKGAMKFAIFKTKVTLNSGKRLFERVRDGYFGSAEGRRNYYRRRVERICMNAFFAYPLKPTAVPIKLIRSTEFAQSPDRDFHLQWSNLTTNDFSIDFVKGEHSQILLDPCVERVAKILRDEIEKKAG